MVWKQIASAILCILITSVCAGQKNLLERVENKDASRYKTLSVELETKKKYSVTTSFKHIAVIDARADQSKLGVVRAGEKPEDRRLVLAEDFTPYLQDKLNKIGSRNAGTNDTAVFVINTAWLYQTLSPGSWLKQQALGVSNNWNSNCFLNIDCYIIKNSGYNWICSIDTIVTSRGWLPNQCNHILSAAFSSAIHFADSIFSNKNYPDSQLSYADFKNLPGSRYNYPMLATQKFSKGIFHSYNDFLENNITSMDVEVYFQKNKRCIKSNAIPDSVINKSWGFSDGENLFMNVDGGYYKLIRSGNTFDLIGPRVIEYKTSLFNKATATAITYFLITRPLIDPFYFTEPGQGMAEGFKLYQLNIRDGSLR